MIFKGTYAGGWFGSSSSRHLTLPISLLNMWSTPATVWHKKLYNSWNDSYAIFTNKQAHIKETMQPKIG
jgi:hypothetical protein